MLPGLFFATTCRNSIPPMLIVKLSPNVVLGPGSLGKESEQANSASRNLAGTAYVRTLSVLQLPQLRKTNGMRSNY